MQIRLRPCLNMLEWDLSPKFDLDKKNPAQTKRKPQPSFFRQGSNGKRYFAKRRTRLQNAE